MGRWALGTLAWTVVLVAAVARGGTAAAAAAGAMPTCTVTQFEIGGVAQGTDLDMAGPSFECMGSYTFFGVSPRRLGYPNVTLNNFRELRALLARWIPGDGVPGVAEWVNLSPAITSGMTTSSVNPVVFLQWVNEQDAGAPWPPWLSKPSPLDPSTVPQVGTIPGEVTPQQIVAVARSPLTALPPGPASVVRRSGSNAGALRITAAASVRSGSDVALVHGAQGAGAFPAAGRREPVTAGRAATATGNAPGARPPSRGIVSTQPAHPGARMAAPTAPAGVGPRSSLRDHPTVAASGVRRSGSSRAGATTLPRALARATVVATGSPGPEHTPVRSAPGLTATPPPQAMPVRGRPTPCFVLPACRARLAAYDRFRALPWYRRALYRAERHGASALGLALALAASGAGLRAWARARRNRRWYGRAWPRW